MALKPRFWLTLAMGMAIGFYGASFMALAKTGFSQGLQWPSGAWTAFFLGLGPLAIWLGQRAMQWLLVRGLGLDPGRAGRIAWISDLPWLALPFGICFYPLMAHFGQTLQLDILGRIYLPGQRHFHFLPPQGYVYLLWLGLWYTLSVFLKFILSVRAWWQHQEERGQALAVPGRMLFLAGLGFYLLLGAWSTTVYPPTGDEVHYLLITHSLVQDGDIDLQNNMQRRDYLAFYPSQDLDFHSAPTPNGKMISKHFPFLSMVLAPGYALAGRVGAMIMIAAMTSLLLICLYQLVLALGFSLRAGLQIWLLAAISVPLAVYYDLVLTEIPAACLLCLAMLGWLEGKSQGAWKIALATGILPWLYPRYISLSVVLAFFWLFTPHKSKRDFMGSAVFLAASGLGFAWFFKTYYSFGISGNPYGEFFPIFSKHSLVNALGLLVDRDFGIFATAPVLLVGLAGWIANARRLSRGFFLAWVLWLTQYLLFAVFVDFTGCAATFSRYMLPCSLLLYAGVMSGWEQLQARGIPGKLLGWLAIAVGVSLAWLNAAWPCLRYLSPKQLLWSKLHMAPTLFPSLALHSDPGTILWALAWVGLLGAGLGWLLSGRQKTIAK